MEEVKEYLVIVKLIDGTEDVLPRNYNWSGWNTTLQDDRKQFVEIENIMYNKQQIQSIQIIPNPDYKKTEVTEVESEEG